MDMLYAGQEHKVDFDFEVMEVEKADPIHVLICVAMMRGNLGKIGISGGVAHRQGETEADAQPVVTLSVEGLNVLLSPRVAVKFADSAPEDCKEIAEALRMAVRSVAQ